MCIGRKERNAQTNIQWYIKQTLNNNLVTAKRPEKVIKIH